MPLTADRYLFPGEASGPRLLLLDSALAVYLLLITAYICLFAVDVRTRMP